MSDTEEKEFRKDKREREEFQAAPN